MGIYRFLSGPRSDLLLFSYFLLLFWIPLPKASNRPGAWFFMELAVFLLLLVWCWQFWRGKRPLPGAVALARPMWFGAGLLIALQLLQLSPLPNDWLLWLSPHSFSIYQLAYQDAELPAWLSLSVDWYASSMSLQKTFAYLGLFALTLLLVRERHQFRWLAWVLVTSAVFQATYGTLMVVTGWEYGFGAPKTAFFKLATGTFVARAHFANYLAICGSVGIALMLILSGKSTPNSRQQRWRELIDWAMSNKIRLRLGLVIIAIGLVMSRSRMGNTAFFVSLTAVGILCLILSRERSKPLAFLVVSILALDMVVVGSFVGIDQVVSRIEQTTATTEHRDEVAEDSLVYWQDFFWLGSGGGSYYATYPRYKDDTVGGYYDHAHNDYLEISTEFGLIGLLLFGAVVSVTFWRSMTTYRRSRDRHIQGVCFAVLMAISILLIHSTVDFNLQMPANASLICVVLALGWVAFYWHQRECQPAPAQRRYYKGSFHQKISLLSLSLALLGLSAWVSCWAITNDTTEKNRYRIEQWSKTGEVSGTEWQRTVAEQQWANSIVPSNPAATSMLGRLLQWDEHFENHSSGLTKQQNTEYFFLNAARLNPGNWKGWGKVATREIAQHRFGPVFDHAINRAMAVAPWEQVVHGFLLDQLLPNWYRLTTKVQTQLAQYVGNAFAINPRETRQLIRRHRRQGVLCARSKALGTDKVCLG